ncbi:hypothetical protein [Adhaeribacter aquaticus]|uniref:hypothetical protein n=1 Tax=Adhaeribacter aquaticus TaxID=299567 RepID=UPI0003FDDA42|nr:hypothetical protein [Adhaeribacter aquaticus]
MEPLNDITIASLVLSSMVAGFSILKMVLSSSKSKNIKITRKDTGKSVTISKEFNFNDSKKLLDILN